MSIINILTFAILLFTVFTNLAFAKEKTIKFHKPQTEAERALDEILVADSMSNDGIYFVASKANSFIKLNMGDDGIKTKILLSKNKLFTSHFIKDIKKAKSGAGSNLVCEIFDGQGLPFAYHTYKKTANKHFIATTNTYIEEPEVVLKYNLLGSKGYNNPQYIMKYEDGIWKLDGLYCHTRKINFSDQDISEALIRKYDKPIT